MGSLTSKEERWEEVPEKKTSKCCEMQNPKQPAQSQQRVKCPGLLSNECLVSLAKEYQVDTRARATAKGMTSLNLICIAMRHHKAQGLDQQCWLSLTRLYFVVTLSKTALRSKHKIIPAVGLGRCINKVNCIPFAKTHGAVPWTRSTERKSSTNFQGSFQVSCQLMYVIWVKDNACLLTTDKPICQ